LLALIDLGWPPQENAPDVLPPRDAVGYSD
jgi:hypothetical protein